MFLSKIWKNFIRSLNLVSFGKSNSDLDGQVEAAFILPPLLTRIPQPKVPDIVIFRCDIFDAKYESVIFDLW